MPEIICPDGQEKLKQFRAVEFFPELLNCLIFFTLFFYLFFLHTKCVNLFSGQDEVRTSNLLHLSWDFLHSDLMLQQLSHLSD